MRRILSAIAAAAFVAAPSAASTHSGSTGEGDRFTINKVGLPGNGRGDYLLVDTVKQHLFVTHAQRVHVLDLQTLKPVTELSGLVAGHGVAVDNDGRAYVTDGKRDVVVVFDPATGHELQRIPVGKGPDSIVFDPVSARIMAFNGESEDISVIDPSKRAVVGSIKLPNAPEFSQADGLGHIYVNLEEGNAVAVIDTKKMVLSRVIPLNGCNRPAPLALDNHNRRLFSGCANKVMAVTNADNGKIIALVPIGGGPDGIVYDPRTKRIFVGNRDGGWTIVKQFGPDVYKVEKTLKIDEYAKTLALDPSTGRIFSSTADLVWAPPQPGKKRLPDAKPGSFRVIIVSQL